MPKPTSTTDRPDSKDVELARLRAQNAEQARPFAELLRRLRELEARWAKDSHNSDKPPSSDPPLKKPPPRSRRERSGNKPGGQKDHQEAARALVEDPEHRLILPLEGRCSCGCECAELAINIRSPEGVAAFATIRSYLSTLRKQSIDLCPALVMTFRGTPAMPRLP